jgi:hypothetical protein
MATLLFDLRATTHAQKKKNQKRSRHAVAAAASPSGRFAWPKTCARAHATAATAMFFFFDRRLCSWDARPTRSRVAGSGDGDRSPTQKKKLERCSNAVVA